MPKTRRPRKGSLQYWPRKKAKRAYARVRSIAPTAEAKLAGFAGYKVGMTHCIAVDNNNASLTKGMDISIPATIIECPPVKVFSIRFHKNTSSGSKVITEVLSKNLDKELARKIIMPKKEHSIDSVRPESYDDITVLVHTQPKLVGFKKKPEVFEMHIGGKPPEKFNYAKENLGKDISIGSIFKEGQQVDIHSITKGKGYTGAVKRFGISLKGHKSEKGTRRPGSLGPWCGQGNIMWKVAHAGQHGYHTRTEYNKWLLKIGDKVAQVNPKGGFLRYGNVKNTFVLVKGSVGGSSKRLIKMTPALRRNRNIPSEAPVIAYISKKL